MNDTERLDNAIVEALDKLHGQYGKKKDDYYGLIFLEHVLRVQRSDAVNQLAFGSHDLGIDGFYFDEEQSAFRIFQFKNSKSIATFHDSMRRLINHGIPALFSDIVSSPDHQPIVNNASEAIEVAKDAIDQVFVDFVFRGNPQEAEQSSALSALKDEIEEQAWRLEAYFGDKVPLTVRFSTFDGISVPLRTDRFSVRLSNRSEIIGPNNLRMCIGFVPLIDLHGVYGVLGRNFLSRNIRFALPPDGYVNRSLARTFAAMLLQKSKDPALFPFHHNGVTLSAGKVETEGESAILYAPRLLNGAQTISTFGDFWERNGPGLKASGGELEAGRLLVSCRIVTGGTADDITEITVSNNRQNPVKPWQLHANDQIQLQLEDWFRNTLRIPYQRQDRAFAKIPAEDWESMELKERKAIELVKLARTYLAVEGEITKLAHIQNIFENEQDYKEVFGEHRLRADVRKVILCYKSQFHIRRIADEIIDKGRDKYAFVHRTKEIISGLVCQALLNDEWIDDIAEEFGRDLSLRLEFRQKLHQLARTQVKSLLKYLIEDKEYASKIEEGNYSKMRTAAAFRKAMSFARTEYGWQLARLRG